MGKSSVDEHVVKMTFDNSKFEKGVSQSQKTLANFKKSLDFSETSKSISNISVAANSVDFSKMAAGIEALQNRFSVLGIVGMRVIENITDSAMKLIGGVFSQIKTGGFSRAMNLENAQFQLEGLLSSTEAVDLVMKNVKDSVDGTAYALDSAAKVAAQLVPSGIEGGEQMYKILKSIAGIAAVTNSSYEDIGDIYTRIAGNGRIMANDLYSFASRGLNAAATLGKQLGKTEAEIRQMVSKGKIDFETFANAMDDAFGEHAKKANETVNGAFSNVKSALSRIGEIFVAPIIKKNSPLVDTLNAIRIKTNDLKASLVPLAETVTTFVNGTLSKAATKINGLDISGMAAQLSGAEWQWNAITKAIENTGVSADGFKDVLIDVARENGIAIDSMIADAGSFEKTFSKGWMTVDIFRQAIEKFIAKATEAAKPITDAKKSLEELDNVANRVIRGEFFNGAERIEALTKAGYDYATVQSLVNSKLLGTAFTYNDLSDAQLKNLGYTEEQISKLRELSAEAEKNGTTINDIINQINKPTALMLVGQTINNITEGFSQLVRIAKTAFNSVFNNRDYSTFYEILVNIEAITKSLTTLFKTLYSRTDVTDTITETGLKLQHTLEGLYSVAHIIIEVLGELAQGFLIVFRSLSPLGDALLTVSSGLGLNVKQADELLTKNKPIVRFFEEISKVTSHCGEAIEFITNMFANLVGKIQSLPLVQEVVTAIGNKITSAFNAIRAALHGTLDETTNAGKILNGAQAIFAGFVSFIGGKLDALWQKLQSLHLDDLKNSFSKFVSTTIPEWKLKIENYVKNLYGKLSQYKFGSLIQEIVEFVKSLDLIGKGGAVVNAVMDALKKKFVDAGNAVSETSQKVSDLGVAVGKSGIGAIKDSLYSFADSIKAVFNKVKDHLKNFATFAGSDLVRNIATVGGIIYGWKAFSKIGGALANAIKDVGGSITKVISSLSNAFIGLGDLIKTGSATLESFQKYLQRKTILDIAKAIALLVGALAALVLLAKYDTDALTQASIALSVMIGLVIAMLGVITALIKVSGGKLQLTCLSLAAFVASLVLVALAFIPLSKIDLEKSGLIPKLGLILGAVAILAATSLLMSQGANWTGALAVSVLLYALVNSLTKIDSLTITWSLVGKVVIIEALLLGMAVVANVMNSTAWASGISGAASILALALSLLILVSTLKKLTDEDSNKIFKGILALLPIIALMAGVSIAISGLKLSSATGLLVFALSLLAIQTVLKIIAKDEAGMAAIYDHLMSLIGLIALIALLAKSISIAGKHALSASVSLLIISAAMILMVNTVKLLGSLDSAVLQQGLIAISIISVILSILMVASSGIQNVQIKTFEGLAIAIATIALSVVALSLLPMDAALRATAEMSVLLIALGACMALIKNLKTGIGIKTVLSNMAIMAAMLVPIVLAVVVLEQTAKDWQTLIAATVSVSLLLLAMSACLAIVSAMKPDPTAAAAVLVAALGLIAIAFALKVLLEIDNLSGIYDAVGGLSLILAAISGICVLLGKTGTAAVAGAIYLDAIIAIVSGMGLVITAMLALIGKINQNGDLTKLLNKAGEALTAVGNAIGGFFGGLINGVLGGIISLLPTLADNLAYFGITILPFITALKMFDDDVISGAEAIAAIVLSLTTSSLLDAVGKFLGSNMDGLGEELVMFASHMQKFYDYVANSNMDPEKLKIFAESGSMIADMVSKMPKEGGFVGKIFGELNLDALGQQLEDFAPHISKFAELSSGLDKSVIEKAVDCANLVTEWANNAPKFGGAQSLWSGDLNLDAFGQQLENFAPHLSTFAENAKNLNSDVIKTAIESATIVTEWANNAPKMHGLGEAFSGSMDLAGFGSQLSTFGISLGEYSRNTSGVNVDTMNALLPIVSAMLDWKPTESAGDMTRAIANIGSIGKALQDFDSEVSKITVGTIESAARGLTAITDALRSASGINDLGTTMDNFERLPAVAEDLFTFSTIGSVITADVIANVTNIIDGIAGAVSAASGIDMTSLNNVITALKTAGSTAVNDFAISFTTGQSLVIDAISGLIRAAVGAIQNADSTLQSQIRNTAANAISLLQKSASDAKNDITASVASIVSALNGLQSQFRQTGIYLFDGFVAGMQSDKDYVSKSAYDIGKEALRSLRESLQVQSPSKRAKQVGSYFGEGFILGINDRIKDAKNAAESLGDDAVSALNKTISSISSVATVDMDVNPVIKPRLDLSEVVAGAKGIGSMFNDPKLALNGSVGSGANSSASQTFIFNQTNNSPRSLSNTEIYRQTKNQFSQFRRAVEA